MLANVKRKYPSPSNHKSVNSPLNKSYNYSTGYNDQIRYTLLPQSSESTRNICSLFQRRIVFFLFIFSEAHGHPITLSSRNRIESFYAYLNQSAGGQLYSSKTDQDPGAQVEIQLIS